MNLSRHSLHRMRRWGIRLAAASLALALLPVHGRAAQTAGNLTALAWS